MQSSRGKNPSPKSILNRNMKHESNKKKQKKNNNDGDQQFEFCGVCKLNHNQGRRHIYFPSHKSSLSALLTRLHSKFSHVKSFLKNPMLLHAGHNQQNRLWCVFCNCDVLELDSPFTCGNAIEHLASGEHYKRVKEFLWKYGGGMDRIDSFRVAEGDFKKWEKKCKSMKKEDAKAEAVGPSNKMRKFRCPVQYCLLPQRVVLPYMICLGGWRW